MLAAQKALLVQDGAPAPVMQTLTVPRDAGPAKVLDDISAVAVLTTGERLVADRGERGVFRFDAAGKYLGPFSPIRASRIALGPVEQIALLDRDTKSVALFDRTGKSLSRIAAKAAGYELMNPADVAFDVLGHLYVLDGTQVQVFAPDGALVATSPAARRPQRGRSGRGRRWRSTRRRGCTSTTSARSACRSISDATADCWRATHARKGPTVPVLVLPCALGAGGVVLRGAQAPAGWDADLAEGQRLFDELDYEHAVPLLSRAILALEPMAPQQPQARTALVSAYGMRARALFGLDDPAKAQDDFRALLDHRSLV